MTNKIIFISKMEFNRPDVYPGYVFGSSIITLVVASLSFLTALLWANAIQKAVEYYEARHDAVDTRFSIAFVVTAISILLIFATLYFVRGQRI